MRFKYFFLSLMEFFIINDFALFQLREALERIQRCLVMLELSDVIPGYCQTRKPAAPNPKLISITILLCFLIAYA